MAVEWSLRSRGGAQKHLGVRGQTVEWVWRAAAGLLDPGSWG